MRPLLSLAVVQAAACLLTCSTPSANRSRGAGLRRSVPADADRAAASYRAAADGAIEHMLRSNPTWATTMGDHRFDDRWPDVSESGEAEWIATTREHARRLRGIPALPRHADTEHWGTDRPALDAHILADALEARALQLSRATTFGRDPSLVTMLVGHGVTSLRAHPYAPLPVRMAALATRLEQVPELLRVARGRIQRPERAGLENLEVVVPGLVRTLRDLPETTGAGALGDDAALAERLARSARSAASALEAYSRDVVQAFPAEAASDDPIGAEVWTELARVRDGVSESSAEIRRIGEQELARLEGELDALMRVDARPGETRAQFFARLERDAPAPDAILDEYRSVTTGIEAWLRVTRFVTIPWDRASVRIEPMPPERRGLGFAAMNTAGPLEPDVSSGLFYVNVPDDGMPADLRAALVAFHARGATDNVSIHEGLPGHHLQQLVRQRIPSKARRLALSATNSEGWAHYCEQAVVEAGYDGGDPGRIRAFMLRGALMRAVRVVVDVGRSDGSLSMAAAGSLLEDKAFLAPQAALKEARRATLNPANMFAYTYGKLSILRLRERVRAQEGSTFDLVRFHDRLLSLGAIPIRYIGPAVFGFDEESDPPL